MIECGADHTRRLKHLGLQICLIGGDRRLVPDIVIVERICTAAGRIEIRVLIDVAVDDREEHPAQPVVQILIVVLPKMIVATRRWEIDAAGDRRPHAVEVDEKFAERPLVWLNRFRKTMYSILGPFFQ